MSPVTNVCSQGTLDELGQPLREVTFCVLDLETTGGSVHDDRITEVGAVLLRGGECLGTFQTLVNPGTRIPAAITVLTGITEAMVLPAPRIDAVLPSLLEFWGQAVLVGHNIGFDLGFLRAACQRSGREAPAVPRVDTVALARRLLGDEVRNHRLGTLAQQLRLDHRPSHRALDDALATGDLLHVLLERAARLGVLGLDDLLTLPKIDRHPQAAKLALTNGLPRAPGVYVFRDRGGRVLYVGKATNLRTRVRSYFSSDRRRKVAQLLRETATIDHTVCAGPLEADVLEVRLIAEWNPRFNRQGTRVGSYTYVKLTTNEAFPRLSVVRTTRDDGAYYLGPLPSTRFAKRVVEAIETTVPLRRCTGRPDGRRAAPCAPAQLGVATCPCAGTVGAAEYDRVVRRARRGLTEEPELLLAPLRERMAALAREQRFEEAADVRERAAALSAALERQRRIGRLQSAGRVVVEVGDGGAEVIAGRLVRSWSDGRPTLPLGATMAAGCEVLGRDEIDELLCVHRWLEERAGEVRLTHCDGGLASPYPRLPTFAPGRRDRRPLA
jgi:DNA polymerase-3 subunit epsilon